jgi:hypothetical protein
MERLWLLALGFASTAFVGCAGLFQWGADPSSFAYSRGQGQILFQLPLAVVVEEVDHSLSDAGFQVTFRHVDRQGAVVKAKSKDGKTAEATLKVDGMLTQLSLKIGRWGDREQTESLITNVKKGVYSGKSDASSGSDSVTDEKKPRTLTPLKMDPQSTTRAEGRRLGSGDEPPN